MDMAQARYPSLHAAIAESIAAGGKRGIGADGAELSAIPFHHYMSLCLYHPDFGYYRSGSSKVGREGDFYTSAYIGDAMGDSLARWLREVAFAHFGTGETVEVLDWGGGTGRLSRQLMDTWTSAETDSSSVLEQSLSFSLTVIDGNPSHRSEAERELESYIREGRARVMDESEWQRFVPSDRPVIVVANELLDAFPVHRLVMKDGELREWAVACAEDGRFIPCLMEPTDTRLIEWLREEGVELRENQTIEINLDGADWATAVAARFKRALFVFIDYGDETTELTGTHRMDGTLLCYREHRAHNDPYAWPGQQDITAHVNFSHIRRSMERHGAKEIWYGTQKRFLVEAGIMERLIAHNYSDPFHPIVRRNRAIRQLLLSDGMSELFKVQIFATPSK
ncbi:class I SAM-dependent methyltransferase [Cohnella sp.]|uniref:class I SAM-dependent methyltransferase n=1 Tax=Cohnella sp. TaxID=1883426 RepID=UPI003703F556